MSWLAPAIVAILSGSVILTAVFVYLYTRERELWMGLWGLAWFAYSVRFGIELAQVLAATPSPAAVLANNLLVLVTGVLLLDGSYLLARKRIPRWHRVLSLIVAAWTIAATALVLTPMMVSTPAWVFRGVANIAAGIVWYRNITGAGPWGKITGATFVMWGLHNLDYPFLRGVASFAAFGFMLGAFLEFILAFGALIAYFELTRNQLRESESRYRSIFEDSASVMLIIDPADARIVQANPAACAYYGWSVGQLTSMKIADISTLSVEAIEDEMVRAQSGERLKLNFTHRLASGQLRDVEVYSGPVEIDGRRLLYSIVHDVTDRARALDELRESEERYSMLFEDCLSPMLLVSTDGARILDANAAAARMYGWQIGTLMTMSIADLSIDHTESVNREVADTVADGGRVRTFTHRRADGTLIDVEIYSTPITSGSETALYTIVNDISARTEAERTVAEYQQHLEELVEQRTKALLAANEELERASLAKDEYLANMSHELRTPLNSVIGFSELLARGMAGDLNEEQRRQIEMINASGQHLLRVVDGILDLARITAGAIEVNIEDVDVSQLCHEVAARVRPIVDVRGVALQTTIEPDVRLRTDPVLLEQVLWNLLGNAAKYTQEGSVSLTLEQADGVVRIIANDTGPGIALEDQQRVFEMFVRLEGDVGVRSDGTGLGLPISKRLVGVLGGTIEFESVYGQGSTFTVILPQEPEPVG